MSSSRYREMEQSCRELAERMSLSQDRQTLLNMAERWRRVAEEEETEAQEATRQREIAH